jgi:thioester reductase-like protein
VGSHFLCQALRGEATIVALVRAPDVAAGRRRLGEALERAAASYCEAFDVEGALSRVEVMAPQAR